MTEPASALFQISSIPVILQKVLKTIIKITIAATEEGHSSRRWLESCPSSLSKKKLPSFSFHFEFALEWWQVYKSCGHTNSFSGLVADGKWQKKQITKCLNLCYCERILRMQTSNSHAIDTSDLPPENEFFQGGSVTHLEVLRSDCTAPFSVLASRRSCWWRGRRIRTCNEMQQKRHSEGVPKYVVSSIPKVSYSIYGMLSSVPRPRRPDPGQTAMDQDLWMVFLVKCSSMTVFGSSAHSWFQLIQLDLLQLSFRSLAMIPIHNPQEHLIKSFWLSSYATQKPSVAASCHHRNTGSSEPNSCLSN